MMGQSPSDDDSVTVRWWVSHRQTVGQSLSDDGPRSYVAEVQRSADVVVCE